MDDQRFLHELGVFRNGKYEFKTGLSIREQTLEIMINGTMVSAIPALADMLEEMAVGFVFSEGYLTDIEEYMGLDISYDPLRVDIASSIDPKAILRQISSASTLQREITPSRFDFPFYEFDTSVFFGELDKFSGQSILFNEIGGIHSAAVLLEGTQLYFAEDIRRQNALDKVCGLVILEDVPISKCAILCSGRITSDIVMKAIRIGFPAIISQSSATSEAIHLAWKHRLYLIAMAQGKSFNVLTGFEHIQLS